MNFYLWRALGVVYLVLLSAGFAYVIRSNAQLQMLALPLTVTLVVSSSILFVSVQDYLLSATLVWLVMWASIQASLVDGLDVYLLIFCASSLSIGKQAAQYLVDREVGAQCFLRHAVTLLAQFFEIGRASCRERV